MKRLLLLLYMIIFIPLATSCWDSREVDKLAIVTGMAIDKTEQGNYLLTFEVVDFMHSTEGQTLKSELIESEGKTIFEAVRNTLSKNAPKLYFGHTTTVVFSKSVAQEGVLELLDFFVRDPEPRLSIDLFVSMEETAGEIFRLKPLTSEFNATEITDIMEDQKNLSKALAVPAYKFVNALSGNGVSGMMTSLCATENNGEKTVKSCGMAVFKKDRLIGFIDEEDTFALCFVLDEVKGGVLVVDAGKREKMALEIMNSTTDIKPSYENGEPSVKVKVNMKAALIDHSSERNFNDKKGREVLVKMSEEQLKNKIEGIIRKVQEDFGSDIFGFGDSFYRDLPKVWKEIEKEWDDIFKDLKVTVETKVKLTYTGLLLEPIRMGD